MVGLLAYVRYEYAPRLLLRVRVVVVFVCGVGVSCVLSRDGFACLFFCLLLLLSCVCFWAVVALLCCSVCV